MRAHQAAHGITTLGRVLGVSVSGYDASGRRPPSRRATTDATLLGRIRQIHQDSHGTYGAPRIHRELRAHGQRIGRKRVARLMRQAGLWGVSRRKWRGTTRRVAGARPAPDLVQRQFAAHGPNQLWVADVTSIPTQTGTLYLAVVLDVWSRRIVGWAMETHLRTALVLAALDMATTQRRPTDVIHHSDQGCQYTAIGFGLRCRAQGIRPSMGSVGDCYDCEDDGRVVRPGLTPVTNDSVSSR
jgi:putative transposase